MECSASSWALECKACWCEMILSGRKSLEVRQYPPPSELEGRRVWLLASQGAEGVATFGDSIAAGQDGGAVVGWVLFDGAVEYRDAAAFAADEAAHCVPAGSPYAFKGGGAGGEGATLYGWRVVASHRLAAPLPLPAMRRHHRSVYCTTETMAPS